jgi:sec-independent protein translocase protein TatA
MGTFSIWHWLIVLAVVLLLFGGRGKISQIMGDFGKGLKSFKSNVKEDSSDGEKDENQAKRIAEDDSAQKTDGQTGSQSENKQDKAANG